MAMEAKALYARLTAVSGVTALVSTRIYPNASPSGAALPRITYQQISGPREITCTGPLNWTTARYQVTCWAKEYDEVEAVSEAVRAALHCYSGTSASVVVQLMTVIDEVDMPVLSPDNEELQIFGKALDVEITFVE